jgi:hypothetical protein
MLMRTGLARVYRVRHACLSITTGRYPASMPPLSAASINGTPNEHTRISIGITKMRILLMVAK